MKLFRNTYNSKPNFDVKKLALYLVTDRQYCASLADFHEGVIAAVKGGVTAVQIREKTADFRSYFDLAASIKPLLDQHNIPLIINDDPVVAKAVGSQWLHLGQKDCPVGMAREILGKNAIIGLSVETLDQAYAALKQDVDYIAISPILASNSRPDLTSPWGLEKAKYFCSQTDIPIVAIGGIKRHNVQQILDCGVSGVCVISDILHQPDPQQAACEFARLIEQFATTRSVYEKI